MNSGHLRFRGRLRQTLLVAGPLCVALLGAPAKGDTPEAQSEPGALFLNETVLDQERLVRMALERNPTVESARLAWEAALNREPQASALDDPVVSYSFGPRTIGKSDTRYGNAVGIAQRFPFPGKLRLRGAVARAEADAVGEQYEATRRNLALVASVLFADYYALERSLETNTEHRALVESLKESAEAAYVAGRSSQQDPIQAEVELALLLRARLSLESQRDVVVAQMNGLLHRAPELPLPPPPQRFPGLARSIPPSAQLWEEALESRPELKATRARVTGAGAALSLAHREYLPDFGLSTSYNSMWNESRHRFMVGASIEVPLQLGRRRAAVAEATAQRRRLEREYERNEDRIAVEVAESRRRAVESQEVVELYRDTLLPASRDRAVAAQSGFETGRNSFLVLIEAERTLRNVELELHEETAKLHRRFAELERAVGRIPGLSTGRNIK